MHHITRRLSPSLFRIAGRRAVVGAAVACVAALAVGGTAVADVIFDFSPPHTGVKRYYMVIEAKHSGLGLNVPDASTKNGTQIIQWDASKTFMNAQWEMLNVDGGPRHVYRNRWSRQCLDVESTADGAPVVQRPCDGTISQEWTRESGDINHRTITNTWSGLDLNVVGASTQPGAKLVQYHRVEGAPNALFKIWSDNDLHVVE